MVTALGAKMYPPVEPPPGLYYDKFLWVRFGTFMRFAKKLFAVLLIAGSADSATINVPADQPTIQAGIDVATDGDTVLVADGVYSGPGNVEISPLAKRILVRSTNGPDLCRIDPSLGSPNEVAIVISSGEDSLTVFAGFTFSRLGGGGVQAVTCNNSSPRFENCAFYRFTASPGYGGAVYVSNNASPTFSSCHFSQNGNWRGGALAVDSAAVYIIDCSFDGNTAGSLNTAYGGAIWAGPHSYLRVRSSSFTNNVATHQQPPGDTRGAAIYCGEGAQVDIDSSEFKGNIAYYGIGGAIFAEQSNVTITSCRFDSNGHRNLPAALSMAPDVSVNALDNPKSYASGGAIYAMLSDLEVTNCVFSANQPPYVQGLATKYRGGAICSDRCTTLISGSTFVDNAARTGYAIFALESELKIDSSIIAFNREIYPGVGAPVACDTFSNVSVSVTCTDIYGNPNGDWLELVDTLEGLYNNFSLDPQFCGRSVGNFYLQEDSPCRPELSPCGSLVGALPVEPGCNSCCEGTTGNANLAGGVDLSDLSLLIAYLTVAPPPVIPCEDEANVNTSGSIDLSDLSAMIAFITAGTYELPWCL